MKQSRVAILRTHRKAALKLAKCNKELRDAVIAKMRAENLTTEKLASIFASRYRVIRTETLAALNGERIVGAAKILDACAEYADRQATADQIRDLTGQMAGGGQVGVAVYPVPVIQLAFDLHEDYAAREKDFRMETFSKVFGPNADVVFNVLRNWKTEALRELEQNPPMVESIFEVMARDDFDVRLEEALSAENDVLQGKAREFQALYQRLLPRHKDMERVSKALGVSSNAVYITLGDKSLRPSVQKLDDMILRARRLLGETPPAKPASVDAPLELPPHSTDFGETQVVRTEKRIEGEKVVPRSARPASVRPAADTVIVKTPTLPDEVWGLLGALLTSLRGSANASSEFVRLAKVELRPQDRLELARVVIQLAELADLDAEIIEEACQGRPIQGHHDVLSFLSTLFGTKALQKG